MKITKTQLKKLIRETVREQLEEISSSPQDAFNRLEELRKYDSLFYYFKNAGSDTLSKIFELRDESVDYSEFYKKVGPGEYDRRTGNYIKNNKFGMRPKAAKMFWELDLSFSEAESLFAEYQELEDRFEQKSGGDQADAVYGRRRTVVIDKLTGEKVSSKTDRRGSLGT